MSLLPRRVHTAMLRFALLLVLIGPVLLAAGCDSAEGTPEFFIVALRNDEPWQAAPSAFAQPFPLDEARTDLVIAGIAGDLANPCPPPNYCQELSISILLDSLDSQPTDTYPLDPSLPGVPRAHLTFLDGDQPIANYETPPEGGGFVAIDAFDEAAQVVAGTFEAVVVNQAAPFDTLRFEQGRFRTRYEIIG